MSVDLETRLRNYGDAFEQAVENLVDEPVGSTEMKRVSRRWVGVVGTAVGIAVVSAVGVLWWLGGRHDSSPRVRAGSGSVATTTGRTPNTPTTTTQPPVVRSSIDARNTPADQRVNVVDHSGTVRGWLIHDDLFGQDVSQPVLVGVYDDVGALVGYYGNISGFVETSVAEAPGFTQGGEVLKRRG